MAVDMFLHLDKIKGAAQDKDNKDQIDILAWSWGMSQSGTTHMGSGGGSGKVNVQDLSCTKYIDHSSADLMKMCTLGQHIATGKLVVRKAGGTQMDYVVIELEDIIVSSISTGGSGGEDRLTENVTLNFRKYNYTYTMQAEDGSEAATPKFGYDIAKNEQAT